MQKLIIKNFRQIPCAEIDITKFTIFIGPQASGKSTIAKLIYFFKSLPNAFYRFTSTSDYIKEGKYYELYLRYIEDEFSKFFLNAEHSDFKLLYSFKTSSEIIVTHSGNKLNITFSSDFGKKIKEKIDFYCAEYKSVNIKFNEAVKSNELDLAKKLNTTFGTKIKEEAELLFSQHLNLAYIPASRNLPVSRPNMFKKGFLEEEKLEKSPSYLDDYFLYHFLTHSETLSKIDNLLTKSLGSHLDDYFITLSEIILRARYIKIDNKEYFQNEKVTTPLEAASTGQLEVIRILQNIYYHASNEIITFQVFEEPEAHLFPKAQKHLIELMALMANKTNSQVVITTHSPYILSIVNNLLYFHKTIERNPNANTAIKKHFGVENLNESENERIYFTKDEIRVYSLGDNASGKYVESIIDPETGLIGANFLDETAEKMYQDFDFMYPLNRKETVS